MHTPYGISSRRAFMQLLAAAGSTAFLPSLLSRSARAAGPKVPTRLLFLYGMGSIKEYYSPKAVAGNAAPTETQFELGELHGPLAAYKSDLIVLDGLDMRSVGLDSVPANGHVNGGTHALTAMRRRADGLSSGISIDQFIAQRLNSPAPVTKYPMWECQPWYGHEDVEGGPSYVAPGNVNPRYAPLDQVYKLFPPGLGEQTEEQRAIAAARLAKRRKGLDYALAEYDDLRPRLSREDRDKLEVHSRNLRDLSAQLGLSSSAACVPPDGAEANEFNDAYRNYSMDPGNSMLRVTESLTRMMVAAFTCDLTRVGMLHLPGHDLLQPAYGFDESLGASNGHDLTHKTAGPGDPLWGNPTAMACIKRFHVLQAQIVANVLKRLKEVTEADGRSLLDHTIVLWCGQLGQGNHSTTNLPWMLAGGGGGQLKTGRYLKYKQSFGEQGPSHSDLFVSLANAMGINITTFGEPSVCNGPLSGLLG